MHWSDFHSSARQREFVKSRQFASSRWCDQEAVPVSWAAVRVPTVPRLPEHHAGTHSGRIAPCPRHGAFLAQLSDVSDPFGLV